MLDAGVPVDIICTLTGKDQKEVVEWNYEWGKRMQTDVDDVMAITAEPVEQEARGRSLLKQFVS